MRGCDSFSSNRVSLACWYTQQCRLVWTLRRLPQAWCDRSLTSASYKLIVGLKSQRRVKKTDLEPNQVMSSLLSARDIPILQRLGVYRAPRRMTARDLSPFYCPLCLCPVAGTSRNNITTHLRTHRNDPLPPIEPNNSLSLFRYIIAYVIKYDVQVRVFPFFFFNVHSCATFLNALKKKKTERIRSRNKPTRTVSSSSSSFVARAFFLLLLP